LKTINSFSGGLLSLFVVVTRCCCSLRVVSAARRRRRSAAQALLVDAAIQALLRCAAARWKNRRSTKTMRLQVVNGVEALLLGRCCCD